ncbi:alanyl-tRNA editing protein Aarsd1 [Anopheles ziemanni]|uniref:alanyl-tRNA editing protein Aarsd1 n=1 Tax=Anopheles coustani TaxID=139045 RepID=UPI00265B1949|nr:alanyl-tRNA editing protein Aarsd1 [Anopheles coustani]XP_058175126.1 alanyl-tRNA editing protein Aarsd1 [Anopheles ziemanni]
MVFKCQEDSFLKEFKTKVVSCEKIKGGFNVVLEDTVLFPEGGGQPSDHGRVNDRLVKSVIRKGAQAVHFIEDETESPPFTVGEEVSQSVDWDRRFDHMQQHSGQHLITAIFDREFQLNTKSWWLGTDSSYIVLDAKDVTREQVERVEKICNQLIIDCTPVGVKVYEPNDPALQSDVTRATRGLPEDVTGPLRVVTIEGVESNMCCGTHVRNLGQLQAVKLLSVEKAKNKCLVHFLVGGRVLRKLSECYEREVQFNSLLNGGPLAHVDLIKKLQATVRGTQRVAKKLSTELAAAEAERLNKLQENPPKYVFLHRCDGPDSDFVNTFLRLSKLPESFIFLTNGDTDSNGKGQMVLLGKQEDIAKLGPEMCSLLEGKGNGKGTRFNAKVNKLKNVGLCEKLVQSHFSEEGLAEK